MFTLSWQPPYDWSWMLGFLAARAVSGIETVDEMRYTRSLASGKQRGLITMVPDERTHTLRVSLTPGLLPVAGICLEKIERLFDLRCEPALITDALGELGAARPGLRLPGSVDTFEQGVRAILGQLVSVAMAAKLTAKVVQRYGEPLAEAPGYLCFPTPEKIASADPQELKALGMPLRRAGALIYLARAALDGTFTAHAPADIESGVRALLAFPGIGRWTANYFALRGWQAKDIFLPDDYLIKQRFPGMTPAQIRRYAERWKPWRSYALLHIWYTDGWQPSVDGEVAGIQ
ncbi:DNA-3-methyladenine glycosylase 2 [Citrobacter rodentium]|uniref:DNA-3-methyladenine glycosylase II n=2 Tax=Citrobacter rodentium TaxID=67825 RepID=D2TQM1_CITRI|nr:DNA-3-methyladenine glycosylase 2 [Citrobacter rodentium]KIQ52553.1 3-methyladenine DNA glycosylase [Citrobacter rodentium]QBY31989.1 DNA-3-methyladenine glycosylase 2 [Citrobacter rodentium]UHO33516.1 DNA-3-methyladenine glycosylase 2 [Citrobacter rodentium NBRC 105723 = DSM 16636]CBG88953.1 DNA-3-methyladenine glycosidase II [Citrobacter rodentium ICC168]HAT8011685.1 DNA-3-methyladenine glycosylase 2 [Citrobacter rodentium NBRC 105723 = DSM 16636]